MTVGHDVSSLLPDVVKNGQTDNLELKKLVYLYLINYAKSQPDLAILAVNTFVKARALFRRPAPRRRTRSRANQSKRPRARSPSLRAPRRTRKTPTR